VSNLGIPDLRPGAITTLPKVILMMVRRVSSAGRVRGEAWKAVIAGHAAESRDCVLATGALRGPR
jgi:hypothetical protein